jgi:Carboxypeptidase regulatory-like domain/TonB dependent receptor
MPYESVPKTYRCARVRDNDCDVVCAHAGYERSHCSNRDRPNSGQGNRSERSGCAGGHGHDQSVTTGAERSATADNDGVYTVTNLQPGLYDVSVQGGGFELTTKRVDISTGGKLTLETKLGIKEVSGQVDVVAEEGAIQVNTFNQEVSNLVSGAQLRELPTLTRNPYDLVGISGNVSPGDPQNMTMRGTGFNINGQRSASTNILLDGGENVDNFTATVGQSIPLDAVGEFRVITSNFSAEYGRASGGIVNVSTRPGTNDFHGSLYEFNRMSRLASNGFDNNARSNPKALFARNQFGYSIGGRIIKEKLFFFNSTEWTRVRSNSIVTRLVPASQLIALSNARTQSIFVGQSLASTPTGNVFTVAQVCAGLGLGGGAFCGLPGATPALTEVRESIPQDAGGGNPQKSYSTSTRIDWNLSNKTQIYGRYAVEKQNFFDGSNANSPWQGFDTGSSTFNQNVIVSGTHTFSPVFVSQTKLVFNRLNQLQPLSSRAVQPSFYFRNNIVSTFNGSNIALPGYLPFSPGGAIPFGGPQNVGQVYEDLNYTKGKHNLRFGGTYVYIQDNRTFGAYENAVAAFGTTSYTTGFNNFVLGNLQRLQVAVDPQGNLNPGAPLTLPVKAPAFNRSNRYNEYALYFNDSWRVKSRLTLSLGVRYEYYGVQKNKDPKLDSNFYYGAGATPAQQVRNGTISIAQDSATGGLWAPDKNNFAPRLGFAWDVKGDGKTSVRGGYGMAYERNFGNITFNVIQNAPAYAVVTVNPGDPGFPTVLSQGDEDSLINFLLFGTSFTKQPRITLEQIGNLRRIADAVPAEPESASTSGLAVILRTRIEDLIDGLMKPGGNERLLFARRKLESQKGFVVQSSSIRDRARKYFLAGLRRVLAENAGYARALEAARLQGDASEQFAERSRLFRSRGLSSDTSLLPNFALEESLKELKARGLLAPGTVNRVAIVGPGLDFTDKQEGYDFYPQQTIQPFAVIDSLRRLGLCQGESLQVTTLDLSSRVNDHLARARLRASHGQSYIVQLPRDVRTRWTNDAVNYWERFGSEIGKPIAPITIPASVADLRMRAVSVRPEFAARISPIDTNIVLQRLDLPLRDRFDLIIATNILVYYDNFEQSLALANVERMLKPGGLMLTNNALLELPFFHLRSVGYSTVVYSDRPDDGDHIVWYRLSD